MKNNALRIFIFRILPKSLISRIFGHIAEIPLPQFILNWLINWYIKKYKVKKEYIIPEKGFKNFNQFFTRKLKVGKHTVDRAKNVIVSPVDALISSYGPITKDTIIQAKGMDYSLYKFIPGSMAKKFLNGNYITLYLSPADYHRIHSPVDGTIIGYENIPGTLFPVQEFIVNGIKGLFTKNERINTYIKNSNGITAVCKIGATNVGKISLAYDTIKTNKSFRKYNEVLYPSKNVKEIKKGEEVGAFNLGSTVILLFQKNMIKFDNSLTGKKIRMGERLGVYDKSR